MYTHTVDRPCVFSYTFSHVLYRDYLAPTVLYSKYLANHPVILPYTACKKFDNNLCLPEHKCQDVSSV
jgi:hypothetical protein